MKALSSSKVVIYNKPHSGGGHLGEAIIGEISGTTISFGTAVDMTGAVGDFSYASLVVLNSTSFVVDYRDRADNVNKSVVGNVSGTNITKGNAYSYHNAMVVYTSLTKLSETKIVIAYCQNGVASFCNVGEIQGTVISWGDKYTFLDGSAFYNSLIPLNETSFALAYIASSKGYALIGTVTNDTEISFGSPHLFDDCHSDISMSKFDNTTVLVSYRLNSIATAIIGSISGETISWGSSNQASFSPSSAMYNVAGKVINSSQFILIYSKGNENGYASVGSLTTINPTGIAAASGNAGDTIKVAFSGLVDGLSGLSANTQYYADDDGNLTTTETARYIGTALSTTSLLIQSALPGDKTNIIASKLSGSDGKGLGNGTSGQVLQSNADGTFSWADMIRLTPQSSAPATCDSTLDGMMALTSDYKLCVCRPDAWKKIDADTACAWTND